MFIRSGYSAQTLSVRASWPAPLRSATKHHDHASDVLVGRGDGAGGHGGESRLDALALQLGLADAVELDDVALAREDGGRPAGRNRVGAAEDPPLPLDADAARSHAHARGAAGVEVPVQA